MIIFLKFFSMFFFNFNFLSDPFSIRRKIDPLSPIYKSSREPA